MSVFRYHVVAVALATPLAFASFAEADSIEFTSVSNSLEAVAFINPFQNDADASGDISNNPWTGTANAQIGTSSQGEVTANGTGSSSWNGNSFQASHTNTTSVPNDIAEELYAKASSEVSAVFTALETTSYQLIVTITAQNYIDSSDQVSGNFSLQSTGAILHDWSVNSGSFSGSATFTFTGSITAGDSFVLMTSASSDLDPFDALTGLDSTGLASFDLSFVTATAIPLPAAGFMGLAGIGGLAISRRRRLA